MDAAKSEKMAKFRKLVAAIAENEVFSVTYQSIGKRNYAEIAKLVEL